MRIKTLDTRFVWGKPETKPKPKGQFESERERGFEWATKKGDRQLYWTSEKKGGYTIRYQPWPGLFRDFAALRATGARAEEEILRFANKYGDILSVPGRDFYQQGSDGGRRVVRRYATLTLWRHHIQQVKWAVGLWDQSNDPSGRNAARLRLRQELQLEIESALRDTATPICARVCLNQKLELFVYPVNLLAFMWLTLARLVSGDIAEQPCLGNSKSCLGYIYTGIGPGLKKTGTVTCSIACRKWKERHST